MYAYTISHLRKLVSTKMRCLKYAEWSTLYLRFILTKVNGGHLGVQNHEKPFSIQFTLYYALLGFPILEWLPMVKYLDFDFLDKTWEGRELHPLL